MGTVYLAVDTSLDRKVALKVLSPRLTSDPTFIDQLRREAKVVASFSHPNVVHVNAFGEVGEVAFIEMEHIAGGSLAEKLRREVVTLTDIAGYALDIAGALAYCHDRGAIHRDIKPSNILIDGQNRARLVDFGIAKAVAAAERGSLSSSWSGLFQGTPSYAPPEAWESAAAAPAWDIYSLGVVLYEAVTGTLPYQADTPLELVKVMALGSVQPVHELNPNVSGELAGLIMEMLSRDVENRVACAQEVGERLALCPEVIETANGVSQTIRVPRSRKRTRARKNSLRLLLRVGLAAGVVVLGTGLYLATGGWGVSGAGDQDTETAAAPGTQQDLSRNAQTTSEQLLQWDKGTFSGPTNVLEARFGSPPREEQWLAEFEGETLTAITAYRDDFIARYQAARGATPGEYLLEGGWSSYGDDASTVLRYGSARGAISVQSDPATMVGTIELLVEQDGSVTSYPVRAVVPASRTSNARFIAGMESARSVQALVFREGLPRALDWASAVGRLFPPFEPGVVNTR